MRRRGLNSRPCFCPDGRKGCFRINVRSTIWAARGSRKSAASPMSASRGPSAGRKYISRPTGAFMGFGRRRFLRVSWTNCRKLTSKAATGSAYGGYAQSRFSNMDTYGSSYATPGWQRAKQRGGEPTQCSPGSCQESRARRGPVQIEGELIASSRAGSAFAKGARVFHAKFGTGTVATVDGNKLTVDFDKAGRKMVLESFVQAG